MSPATQANQAKSITLLLSKFGGNVLKDTNGQFELIIEQQVSDSGTLKLRMEPHRYRTRNGKLYCACPRCGSMQEITVECASCGQLM